MIAARMLGAFLPKARMNGANLVEAWLEGAHPSDWIMTGVNLSDASLSEAFFWKARMERADLKRAWLEGSDLSTTQGLTPEQLAQAFGDGSVILPDGEGIESANWPAHWPKGVIGMYNTTEYDKWLASPSTYVPPAP